MGNSRETADSKYGVYVQPAERKIGISGTMGGDFSYVSGAADGGLVLGVSGSDWVTVNASGQATMATSGTGYALKLENESNNGEVLRLVSGDGVTMYIQTDHIYNSSALHIGNSQNIYLRGGKIGVNTTGPWSDLSVSGDMGATGWVSGTAVSGSTLYANNAPMVASGTSIWIGQTPRTDTATNSEYSTYLGFQAGMKTTTGDYNVGIGYKALSGTTTPSHDTAVGYHALKELTTLSAGNTAVGSRAGDSLVSGSYNVLLGYQACKRL
jgi:hypothetical protein